VGTAGCNQLLRGSKILARMGQNGTQFGTGLSFLVEDAVDGNGACFLCIASRNG
jgi:hypothetical protein